MLKEVLPCSRIPGLTFGSTRSSKADETSQDFDTRFLRGHGKIMSMKLHDITQVSWDGSRSSSSRVS